MPVASLRPVHILNIMFYLLGIPAGSTKVVDLKDEVVLYPLQPLDSQAFICCPRNGCQVVVTVGQQRLVRLLISDFFPPIIIITTETLICYLELKAAGTTTSVTLVVLVSTTNSLTVGLGVPGCSGKGRGGTHVG